MSDDPPVSVSAWREPTLLVVASSPLQLPSSLVEDDGWTGVGPESPPPPPISPLIVDVLRRSSTPRHIRPQACHSCPRWLILGCLDTFLVVLGVGLTSSQVLLISEPMARLVVLIVGCICLATSGLLSLYLFFT